MSEAEDHYRPVVDEFRVRFGKNSRDTLKCEMELAKILCYGKSPLESALMFESCIERLKASFGEEDELTMKAVHYQSCAWFLAGYLLRGFDMGMELQSRMEKILNPGNPALLENGCIMYSFASQLGKHNQVCRVELWDLSPLLFLFWFTLSDVKIIWYHLIRLKFQL